MYFNTRVNKIDFLLIVGKYEDVNQIAVTIFALQINSQICTQN
ncbi:MAG: hypothetical protein R2837_01665 [Aliarcobacter sp.]